MLGINKKEFRKKNFKKLFGDSSPLFNLITENKIEEYKKELPFVYLFATLLISVLLLVPNATDIFLLINLFLGFGLLYLSVYLMTYLYISGKQDIGYAFFKIENERYLFEITEAIKLIEIAQKETFLSMDESFLLFEIFFEEQKDSNLADLKLRGKYLSIIEGAYNA